MVDNKPTLPRGPMKERAIDVLKAALLMGVLLIHSNISRYPGVGPEAGAAVGFVSRVLCSVCVPGFFVISGMLFFRGVDSFNAALYTSKLRSRAKTLLAPYLLWNAIAAVTDIFKDILFGIPTPGFIEDGHIHWAGLLTGFWSIFEGRPLAFAFWFIRNLMVFVLLSPLAWAIARRGWLFAAVTLLMVAGGWGWGFEYFLIGTFIGMHRVAPPVLKPVGIAAAMAVYLQGAWVMQRYMGQDLPLCLHGLLTLAMTLAALWGAYSLAKRAGTWIDRSALARRVIAEAFFIYAFHQLFCTVNCRFWTGLCPPPPGWLNVAVTLFDYFMIWLTYIVVSLCAACVLRRCLPRAYSLLTGSRATH